MDLAETKGLISFMVTALVDQCLSFRLCKNRFSHDVAQGPLRKLLQLMVNFKHHAKIKII